MQQPDEDLVANAEAFLAVAVIQQVFLDTGWLTGSKAPTCGTAIDRDQARAFLLSTHGEWAAAREVWATAADLDPDWIRDIARRLEKRDITARRRPINRTLPNRPLKQPTPETVVRTTKLAEYLASRGIDALEGPLRVIANALNEGGFTTPWGCKFKDDGASNFRTRLRHCIQNGHLKNE